MKTIILTLLSLFVFSFFSFSQLEKDYQGKYSGAIPAYETTINEQPIQIGENPVSISFDEDKVEYEASGTNLTGTYEIIKDKRKEKHMIATVGNGRSLEVVLHLKLDIKSNTLYIEAKNDQPEATLKKVD